MDYDKILEKLEEISIELESYNDYPESASNNAKRGLRYIEEYGDEINCNYTRVGLARANQLANKENISWDTISRMASFNRHKQNAEVSEENKNTPYKNLSIATGEDAFNFMKEYSQNVKEGKLSERILEFAGAGEEELTGGKRIATDKEKAERKGKVEFSKTRGELIEDINDLKNDILNALDSI